jgi:hypothetical protein
LKSAAPPSVRHRFRVSGVKPGAPPPVVVVPAPPPVVVPPPPALPPSTPFRRDVPPAPIVVAPPPAPVVVAAPPSPMADLGSLVAAIRGEAFSQAKLGVLGDAARAHWFSVDQVKQLLGLFAFSPDKLSALRLLAPRLVDPQNRYQIYSAFTFSSDKEEARQILGQ